MSGTVCPICGTNHEGQYREVSLSGVSAPSFNERVAYVCGSCAGAIANLYSIRHSGEPVSWAWSTRPFTRYRKEEIPQALRWEVFRRDGFTCICGSQSDLTADHIHPESLGGKTTLENLRTLCRSCNSKKGARANGEV